MKSFFKWLLSIIILVGVIVSLWFGTTLEKTDSALPDATTNVTTTKYKIKSIRELATSSQIIQKGIDANYISVQSNDIKLFGFKILTTGTKNITNKLVYVQKWDAKAGYKNIEIWKTANHYEIITGEPLLLSFELLTDSIINESGYWSKKRTSEIEDSLRRSARREIKDSLFMSAQKNMQTYINELIESIEKNAVVKFKTR